MLGVRVPRVSHHRHSWRLRPHRETSYALLVFMVAALGVLLASASYSAEAAVTMRLPSGGLKTYGDGAYAAGSYEVQATVTGPRPTAAPVILQPATGQTFSINPVHVEGTCPAKTLIKIFKNGALAGSAICNSSNRFVLDLDLLIGRNELTAIAYNTLDQPGPTSAPVVVTLNLPGSGFGFSQELVLQSTSYYRGVRPGEEVTWPLELVGGLSPYAVNFQWGDGKSDLTTRLAPGPFTLKHTYDKPGGYLGAYPLIIRATDAAGHTAYLQLTTIVNEPTGTASAGTAKPATSNPLDQLKYIWPLWALLLAMVLSFWLGERREKGIMRKRLAALA